MRCVVSTNALELGIDIGALDVAVMAGYPGTIAATWQRAGRAGRRSGRSAAVLVASSAPIDQFVVRHPEYFFGASPEHALVNPDNLHILLDHVKCAAFELPFTPDDPFGAMNVQEILTVLTEEGFVHFVDGPMAVDAGIVSGGRREPPFGHVRQLGDHRHHEWRARDRRDRFHEPAHQRCTEKAIYIVEGQLFQVERFDFDERKAFVRAVECDYYTDAITYTKVTILETFQVRVRVRGPRRVRAVRGSSSQARLDDALARGLGRRARASCLSPGPASACAHGEVHVVSRVVGFKKIKFYTNENVGSGELELPEQEMHTTSYWLTIPARGVMTSLPFRTGRPARWCARPRATR